MLRSDIEPLVALLPDGTDPDSFVREQGREALDRLVAKAQDFGSFVAAGRERGAVSEQRQAVRELSDLIRLMPDEAARQLYANRVAALFDIDRSVILGGPAPRQPATAKPSGSKRGLEEKLVAAAARDAELAEVARELGLAECVADPQLHRVAEVAASASGEAGFGPARVMDGIEEDGLRRRVAQWTFDDDALPSVEEYRGQVRRFRADWLQRRIDAAQSGRDERLAEELVSERSRLLQDVVRERRGRR
jgi:DNA primase